LTLLTDAVLEITLIIQAMLNYITSLMMVMNDDTDSIEYGTSHGSVHKVLWPAAKFTKHRTTNLRKWYDIQKVYDRFTTKCDLQKIVQKSYKKHTTKLRQNVRQLTSFRTTASIMHAVIILIFHLYILFTYHHNTYKFCLQ